MADKGIALTIRLDATDTALLDRIVDKERLKRTDAIRRALLFYSRTYDEKPAVTIERKEDSLRERVSLLERRVAKLEDK